MMHTPQTGRLLLLPPLLLPLLLLPLLLGGLAMTTPALAVPQDTAPATYPNTAGFGRDVDPVTPWVRECLRVARVQPPVTTPAPPAQCQGHDYYDKVDQAATSDAEWGKVRACAAAANDNGVLATLYANGQGVPRNLDLATHYACRAGGALMEVQWRIAHLQALRQKPSGKLYDQCDDATSGFMTGLCAGFAERRASKTGNAYFSRLRSQMVPQQVAPFDQLIAAGLAFARARQEEMDYQGTIAAARAMRAEAVEKEWLREQLMAFEKGTFQLPRPQQLPVADAALNRLYQSIMARPSADKTRPDQLADSTVTKTDVRTAQRLWLRYRDAWVRFAALRYPALPADALKAALTQWRAKQLDSL